MKRYYYIFFLLWLLPGICGAPPVPWVHRIAEAIQGFMWRQGETYWQVKGLDHIIPVREAWLADCVGRIEKAARLNPGWGPDREATRRWCVAVYTQSRFFPDYVARNRNGSYDYGLAQVNDVHWREGERKGLWYRFCQETGRPTGWWNVWNIQTNLDFAAWYNQWAIENDQDTYHFNRTKLQQELYAKLRKVN